jgi:phage terminase small subunit
MKQEPLSDETPLQYLLRIMRDPTVDPARRDRAAQMAAPYCHPRMYDNRFGKRDAALEAAHKAADDSEWAQDLGPADRTVN